MKDNTIDFFGYLLILLYSVLSFAPHFFLIIPSIIKYVLVVLVVLFLLLKTHFFRTVKGYSFSCISVLLFSLYILIYKGLGVSSSTIGNIYNQISFFVFFTIALYLNAYCSKKQIGILVLLLSIVFFATVIKSISQYIAYGDLLETLSDEELVQLGFVNSTPFNTSVFITLCFILYYILNSGKKVFNLFLIAVSGFLIFYLFYCGSRGSIIIMLLALFVFLPIIRVSQKDKSSTLVSLLFCLFLFVLILLFSNRILDALISISPDRLADRFRDLKQASTQGISDHSFSGRVGLYRVSLNSFLRNIGTVLFGIGDHRGSIDGVITYAEAGIGGHSEILDSLARWGIIGCSMIVYVIVGIKRFWQSFSYSFSTHLQIIFLFVLFIICCFVKSVFHPMIGCAVFILPLYFLNLKEGVH